MPDIKPLPIPRSAGAAEVMRAAADALGRGVDACVATVTRRSGSTPCTPGQKLVLCADGTACGTVGGGAVERVVVEKMLAMLSSGEGDVTLLDYRLAVDLGMSCGGSVQILVEPIFGSSPVLVVGAGHVGLALASLLLRLGFSLTLADERPSALAPERLAVVPGARAKLGRASEVAAGLPRRAAVVVATHEHALDQDAVAWALREGFAFVGGVGSRGKAARIRKELLASGLPESALASLRMPVGVEIGARSPEEIALAIAAQLVAWRSEGGGGAAQAPAPTPAPQEEPCTAT